MEFDPSKIDADTAALANAIVGSLLDDMTGLPAGHSSRPGPETVGYLQSIGTDLCTGIGSFTDLDELEAALLKRVVRVQFLVLSIASTTVSLARSLEESVSGIRERLASPYRF